MDGVQRSDWLDREGAPGSRQDVVRHGYQVAFAGERFERVNRVAVLCLAQPAGRDGSDERPIGLGERQKRRDAPFARPEGALSGGVLLE